MPSNEMNDGGDAFLAQNKLLFDRCKLMERKWSGFFFPINSYKYLLNKQRYAQNIKLLLK